MPIEPGHIRWPVERGKKGDFANGDLFEAGWLHLSCHGFTHVDAPAHMVPGGATLTDLQLEHVIGETVVVDLAGEDGAVIPEAGSPDQAVNTRVAANQPVDAELLEARSRAAGGIQRGDIVLLRSCWYEQRDWHQADYWLDAPWLTRGACEWLLDCGPTAVAFDFPQDWTIRLLLHGEVRPIAEHVSHDILLRNNVTLIEYLVGTRALTSPRTWLCAQPLNLPGADGAPARVVAIES